MKKCAFLLSFILGLTCFQLRAQSVAQVIDDYLEAVGGNAVLSQVKGMKMKGKMTTSGVEFPFIQVIQLDGRQYMQIDFMGNTFKQRVYNGEKMWSYDMATQQAKYDSDEVLNNAKLDFNDFPDALYGYKEKQYTYQLEGKETRFGREVYKVKVRKEDKMINGNQLPDIVYYFFDVEKNISVAQETIGKDENGNEVSSVLRYSDYGDVGNGYLMPLHIIQEVNGQSTFELTISEVELNPTVSKAEFAYPGN